MVVRWCVLVLYFGFVVTSLASRCFDFLNLIFGGYSAPVGIEDIVDFAAAIGGGKATKHASFRCKRTIFLPSRLGIMTEIQKPKCLKSCDTPKK